MKRTYGWPMNEWCVGNVDDMQLLFVGKREFNEDISGECSCFFLVALNESTLTLYDMMTHLVF